MKSIWLVVIVFSFALAEAEKNALGYKLTVSVFETLQSNGKDLNHDLRPVASDVDQLMDDQRLSKSTLQNLEQDLTSVVTKMDHLTRILEDHTRTVVTKMDQLIDLIGAGEPRCPENATDGVYNLKPVQSSIPTFSIYCENGWIVIHRRFNGSMNFSRTWNPYREGFGDLQGEHWLGLEKMHQITRVGSYELKVVLKSFDGVVKTAKYNGFKIGSEIEQYRLNLEEFVEGNAGDSLMYHNTMKFSALDRENDQDSAIHCAVKFNSGWWFKNCYEANLNGFYEKGNDNSMSWVDFNNDHVCLMEARMMIRAVKLNE